MLPLQLYRLKISIILFDTWCWDNWIFTAKE